MSAFPETVPDLLDAIEFVSRGDLTTHKYPACAWCGEPTFASGRLYAMGGKVIGRLCPEHSAESLQIDADGAA